MADLASGLHRLLLGGGLIRPTSAGGFRLAIPAAPRGYADAQLDDTARLTRSRFVWKPPVRLGLRARASSAHPAGTLGFGFWNDPFAFSWGFGGAGRLPASPRALWFFYGSPPNDFTFVPEGEGRGWKAMSIDGPDIPSLVLAPLAAAAVILARVPLARGRVVRAVTERVHASEQVLKPRLDEWHTYFIEWTTEKAGFRVDGQLVLEAVPPRPPMGLVIWIDNQFAVVSPQKGFDFGTVPSTAEQWLEIEDLRVESP